MPTDDHELILDAITTLRRPAWPAAAPSFGELATAGPATDAPIDAIDRGYVRANRWTCELSPDRFRDWRDAGTARSRTLVIHAIDAEPAVPIQLYWLLSNAEAFGRAVRALGEALREIASVVVVVPDDVPARWRPACKAFTPRRIDSSYPAGNWRLVARAAGIDSRHALVLDAVAAIDLVAGNDARPFAIIGDGDARFRTVRRDATLGEIRGAVPGGEDEVDFVIGPRLRQRKASDDAAVGDGDLTLHAVPRDPVERSPCVRCSWCVAACPTRCDPVELMRLALASDGREHPRALRRAGLDACVDCGLCTAVCPSLLPLHGYIDSLRRRGAGADS